MIQNGYEIRRKSDSASLQQWERIPPSIELYDESGSLLLRVDGAGAEWSDEKFEIGAASWEIPDPPPVRRLVAKSDIVDRLHDAGKLDAARAALDASDLYTRERWNTRDMIYADDPTALGLLRAIGADPAVIFAP